MPARDKFAVRLPRGQKLAVSLPFIVLLSCSAEGPAAPDAPDAPPSGAVVTVSATGVVPKTLHLQVGERAIFTNEDTVDHDMSSDAHPSHLDCPSINQVGYLRPGDTRETGNFVTAAVCTFHDHLNPNRDTLRGTIIISE